MHRVVSPRAGAVAVVLVCAAGCTATPPPPEEMRKEATSNVNFDHPWKANANASAEPVQDNWLATFNDPVLNDLVREALANNPDLRIAAARVEQSAGYMRVAQAALRPWIGIAGTGGAKAGGGTDPSSALQGVVAAMSWEVDLWGRVRYARNAAEAAYASAQADYEYSRQSIAASTAKAYFTATQMSANVAAMEQMTGASR